MRPSLIDKLEVARRALDEDPDGILLGEIRFPCDGTSIPESVPDVYKDFLSRCNGGRFGVIDFFGAEKLGDKQFVVEYYPGGETIWYAVGQLLYEPVLIQREENVLYCFNADPPIDTEGLRLGTLEYFLENVALGPDYASILPGGAIGADRWHQFLMRVGFIPGR